MPKFMVIETFKPNCRSLAYDRFYRRGRLLPPGLKYLDSWLEAEGNRCFQLMETADSALFDEWIAHWEDLVSFEVVELGGKPQS
ncbi:DUF3303 family protein [Acaryochloris sp. IP29b_bin.148]|uniref:DUF3303 domain-containing protein n=1 Tax=Acaryochloris sp. IP29b_bin.148 TaxID=2969218 RepID=UPI0026353C01|nr:DUF3303 family protein [Acaryochloris sp. IP29b_bin.148]